ncbi:hypothetical protein [Amycolatopsis cihanbeyliensis]|uniref:Uncharacterized protein n=1 Tax=Amycolatopsis cihanbeyliensis TaxID=1128664 RepID=A0A542CTX3_AMYCI|nr:hypothetical protein [Amycolatopsis cihanbeyliensis]TQI94263.1 hypothetical protein FB471_6423 [Amycolatopsis cihanbeyliensis]
MPELHIPDPGDRDTLAAFVARAVRLDGQTMVRLRERERGAGLIEAWVATPFDVLVTRAVVGVVSPSDLTVSGNELLAALTVTGGKRMDPGPPRDLYWQSELPMGGSWRAVDDLPAEEIAKLAERGVTLARDNVGPQGTPPASLMDQTVLTVSSEAMQIKVPMRCLFALSGMGFLDASRAEDVVRVTATDSWMRLDARYGAALRRRHALLPLLF